MSQTQTFCNDCGLKITGDTYYININKYCHSCYDNKFAKMDKDVCMGNFENRIVELEKQIKFLSKRLNNHNEYKT